MTETILVAHAIVCCAHDPLGQPHAQNVGCKRLYDQRGLNIFPRVIESTRQQCKRIGIIGRIWKHHSTLPRIRKGERVGF
jgi:hypothetical protein